MYHIFIQKLDFRTNVCYYGFEDYSSGCYHNDDGGSLFAESFSSDYIEIHLEIYWKGDLSMLTVTDLIAVLALCATFYSLGYMHGKHDSKTQK